MSHLGFNRVHFHMSLYLDEVACGFFSLGVGLSPCGTSTFGWHSRPSTSFMPIVVAAYRHALANPPAGKRASTSSNPQHGQYRWLGSSPQLANLNSPLAVEEGPTHQRVLTSQKVSTFSDQV